MPNRGWKRPLRSDGDVGEATSGLTMAECPSLHKVRQRGTWVRWVHWPFLDKIVVVWEFQVSSACLNNFLFYSNKLFANIKKSDLLWYSWTPLIWIILVNVFIPLASLFWHLGNPEHGPWLHPAECLAEKKNFNQVITQITKGLPCDELCQGRIVHNGAHLACAGRSETGCSALSLGSEATLLVLWLTQVLASMCEIHCIFTHWCISGWHYLIRSTLY